MLGVLYQRPSIARPRADRWTRRVDGASLGVFRIAFGLVGLLSVVRLIDRGWATTRYAGPTHRFTYLGFGWVPKPSPAGMLVLLAVVGVAAALVAVGWHYRPAIATFFLGFTWIKLIDVTTYLNHYVFVSLMAFLLCFVPADASLSIAARRRGERTVPVGVLWLLRAQVGRGVRVRRDRQAPRRLAGARAAAAPVAPRARRARSSRRPARAALDRPRSGPRRRGVRLHHRRPAAVAPDPAVRLRRRRRLPRGDLAALPDRRVPVADDRRRHPVLHARLAASPGIGSGVAVAPPNEADAEPEEAGSPRNRPRAQRLALVAGRPGWWSRCSSLSVTCCTPAMLAGRTRGTASPGTSWPSSGPATSPFRVTDPVTGEAWTDDARALYTADQWRLMATEPDLIHQAAFRAWRGHPWKPDIRRSRCGPTPTSR